MVNNKQSFNLPELTIAFIKADITEIQEALINWQTPLVKGNNNSLSSERITGDFNSAYEKLFPLTSVEIRRYLLLPTASQWVGIIDNYWRGTDRTCPWVLAELLRKEHIFMFCHKNSGEFMVDYFNVYRWQVKHN